MEIISKKQNGFVRFKSTIRNLIEYQEKILIVLEEGAEYVDNIYLDLLQEFDSCLHVLLIKRLKSVGFERKLLKLFCNSLWGRKMKVIANRVMSREAIVNS